MVTVSQITDNPFVFAASQKLQTMLAFIGRLSIEFWRNLLILLSAIWICHSAANMFWLVFPTPVPPQPTKLAMAPSATAVSSASNIDIASLQGMELFGTAGAATEEGVVEGAPLSDDENASETRLNLKLQGVIASDQSAMARAIIDDGKEQILLRIGEELPRNKGVKLSKIMDKKVILDNNGRSESLSLYDDDGQPSLVQPATYRVPQQSRPEPVRDGGQKAVVRPDQMPKSISDIVRFSVHRENGAMIGYRVRPGRERELFDQVGLKANDIVTTVNGIRMDDPKQLKMVYQSLKTATSADLGVLRGGEELSIHISVEGE